MIIFVVFHIGTLERPLVILASLVVKISRESMDRSSLPFGPPSLPYIFANR
jgi:hypothetical protein